MGSAKKALENTLEPWEQTPSNTLIHETIFLNVSYSDCFLLEMTYQVEKLSLALTPHTLGTNTHSSETLCFTSEEFLLNFPNTTVFLTTNFLQHPFPLILFIK